MVKGGVAMKINQSNINANWSLKRLKAWFFCLILIGALFVSLVGNVSAIDIYEPDDTPATATPTPTDGTVQSHDFHVSGDDDWLNFSVVPGTIYTIETFNLGPPCDTYIQLYENDSITIIDWDDDSGPEPLSSRIIWDSSLYLGSYCYIRVTEYGSNFGASYTYDIRIFEGLPAEFQPPHSDSGWDVGSDGWYDYLIVDVVLNITTAGNYNIDGSLWDQSMMIFITSTTNFTYLNIGTQVVQLLFSGPDIFNSTVDGPYNVSLYLYDDSVNLLDSDTYSTNIYSYPEFQSLVRFAPPHEDYGLDTDIDILFNYLIINVTINVTTADFYYIDGNLWDQSMIIFITSTMNFTYLDAGIQVVQLLFSGPDIFNSSVDGPYNVSLDLYDDSFNLLDSDIYTTNSYSHLEFQALPRFAPPHEDYGLDTDIDILFNYLVVNVTINVTTAGNYYITGDLWD
jgi:hypothetical protein